MTNPNPDTSPNPSAYSEFVLGESSAAAAPSPASLASDLEDARYENDVLVTALWFAIGQLVAVTPGKSPEELWGELVNKAQQVKWETPSERAETK